MTYTVLLALLVFCTSYSDANYYRKYFLKSSPPAKTKTKSAPPQAVIVRSQRGVVDTCADGYEDVAWSTMCLQDNPYYIPGSAGVSEVEKWYILAAHNYHRANVYPTAAHMPKLYWNDELARIAEKWAKQCYVGHEENLGYSRFIPDYGQAPGQNAAFGYTNWADAVHGWHGEVRDYIYGEDPEQYLGPGGWAYIGHYTQVVQDSSVLIGCGYAECSIGYNRYYICNYMGPQWSVIQPYTSGPPCSGCPDTCVNDGLCDCEGKFCFNGGELNLNTCQCSCVSPFTGKECMDQDCPDQDPGYCGTDWPPSFCDIYFNVPFDCPYMCGTC